MMNKNKTSKVQLMRLWLLLPVTAIVIFAFKPTKVKQNKIDKKVITTTGLVVDAETLNPLASAELSVKGLNIHVVTDSKGFYRFEIPYEKLPLEYSIEILKEGYTPFHNLRGVVGNSKDKSSSSKGSVEFIGMNKEGASSKVFTHAMDGANASIPTFTYDSVLVRFEHLKQSKERDRKLEQLKAGNEKVFFMVDGNSYVISETGSASLGSETDIIFVNGKQMTPDEVNKTIKRTNVVGFSADVSPATIKKYGKGILSIQTKPEKIAT